VKELDFRWHVINFLKLGLFSVLCGGFCLLVVFGIRLLKGVRYRLTFRDKLLASFILVSVLPVMILWYYIRDFALERSHEIVLQGLMDDVELVAANVRRALGTSLDVDTAVVSIDNDFCKSIAALTQREFNFFANDFLVASSRPELYETELLDKHISGAAYVNIMLMHKAFYAETEAIGQFPYLVGYHSLVNRKGRIVGAISVPTLYQQTRIEQEIAKNSAFIFGGYALVVIIIIVLGTIIADRISRPIRSLTEATKRISSGELNVVVGKTTRDEIGDLVDSFNKMTKDLKHIQKELAQAERELAWREMAKQVAHEIKNPLTPMKLSTQHLRQAFRDGAQNFGDILNSVTQTLIEQIDALSRIASEFSRFAKLPKRKFELCSVNDTLKESIALFEQEKGVDFYINFSDNMSAISADKEELRRAFINIIRNGIQAMNGAGVLSVQTHLVNGAIAVVISDTGCGIPDEVKERLFEPNFSTKTDGMGLGLAMTKKTIDDLNGTIEIISEVGRGTEVKILLPVGEPREVK
jgi:signal transduction histidine kinase